MELYELAESEDRGSVWPMNRPHARAVMIIVVGRDLLALLTVLKKIDFDLSMLRVASRRHIFEAHVNGFTLVLQVHGAKPFDDLAQQASVRLG